MNRLPGNDVPSRKAPWHERVPLLGWLRRKLRKFVLRCFAKLVHTGDARAILFSSLNSMFEARHPNLPNHVLLSELPFADLGKAVRQGASAERQDVIIITARFRSGSTLLWTLFRHIEGCTAYYEPFNDRRWFDPTTRGTRIDPTHRKAEAYWREYEGLTLLGEYYRESWIDHHLFMDANSWDPDMKRYVELLIEHARGRPVLQFNRIDFRLPWFRHHFPHAKIVHLYRHPRDQWCSSLVDPSAFPKDRTMADFAPHDGYYLRNWAADLKYHYPFLDERQIAHPYELFYYLWKLSFLFGQGYAHYSLAFENLVSDPTTRLEELCEKLSIINADINKLRDLIVKPPMQRWRSYADDEWFLRHETNCENILADFFGTGR